ncbi:alpha/beta fold hydrolase [Phaeacidiphilus oryzae]|uniref:alpha/beta fold hydrolase n=1 Tax=Phaeacidiphilus oryzae TaxID=348818 RepID=UPI00068E60A0|nr:alpha/beta fold hydrolase [Phaeacidiphilus oryzae]
MAAAPGAPDFFTAYEALLARWPAGTRELDVPTPYGSTRVHAYGPESAPPLLLLHGGGATGGVWYRNARALGERYRVLAVDVLGDAGRSVRSGRPLRRTPDLMGWLDALLDGLELSGAHLLGHSYGGWIALNYALHAPRRVNRLVLLDPTQCFAGYRPAFLLRSLPALLRPSTARALALVDHETAETAGTETAGTETTGTQPDPDARRVYALAAAGFPDRRLVVGRRPDPSRLSVPLLVLLAGRSGVHDVAKVTARARAAVPDAEIETLPGLAHFSLPTALPDRAHRRIADFLGGVRAGDGDHVPVAE